MNDSSTFSKPICFAEHICVPTGQKTTNLYDIVLDPIYTPPDYAEALFTKILTIGLHEISPFLDYHCEKLLAPAKWLKSLEKLIDGNLMTFNTPKLKPRYKELILQINDKRYLLQTESIGNHRQKLLSSITKDKNIKKVFCFTKVKEQLCNYSTHEEKIAFLQNCLFEYRQESSSIEPFDVLLELEIQRQSENQKLQEITKVKTSIKSVSITEKMKINCKLNYFVDIFFQLMHKILIGDKTFLVASNRQIATIISQNFIDKRGQPITFKSVMTVLEYNRNEKRPHKDRKFNLE